MEETYNLQAIVLKRQAFRESDLKITIYTKEKGKLELVARGCKKPSSKLASHIEPFNFSSIMAIRGRQFDYVGSAICRNSNINLKGDLEKLKYAGQALNIFNKLVKEEEQEDSFLFFDLLKDYLSLINCEDLDNNLFYHIFLLKLLSGLGYQPELKNCVVCGNEGDFFSFFKGGLVCDKHKESSDCEVLNDVKKALILVINNEILKLKNLSLNDLQKNNFIDIINIFYRYQID